MSPALALEELGLCVGMDNDFDRIFNPVFRMPWPTVNGDLLPLENGFPGLIPSGFLPVGLTELKRCAVTNFLVAPTFEGSPLPQLDFFAEEPIRLLVDGEGLPAGFGVVGVLGFSDCLLSDVCLLIFGMRGKFAKLFFGKKSAMGDFETGLGL